MVEIKKYPQCCERCGQIFEAEGNEKHCEDCRTALKTIAEFKRRLKNAMIADIKCERCGDIFSGNYATAKYCPVCREAVKKEYSSKYRRAVPKRESEAEGVRVYGRRAQELARKPSESIAQCVGNAQKMGMSYGEYVAWKYYGGGKKQ